MALSLGACKNLAFTCRHQFDGGICRSFYAQGCGCPSFVSTSTHSHQAYWIIRTAFLTVNVGMNTELKSIFVVDDAHR